MLRSGVNTMTKDALPYIAILFSGSVLLFGNNLFGNSAEKSTNVALTLAILQKEAIYSRERTDITIHKLNHIKTILAAQGEAIHENNREIAVISNTLDKRK